MARSWAAAALLGAAALAGSLAACRGPDLQPTATLPPPATVAPDQPSVGLGARLYAEKCSACHGDREGRGGIPEAPRHDDSGHTWHHPDAQLRDWVLNGKIGFSRMPPQKDNVSEAELDLIFGYIKTWWTPDQRALQEAVSKRYQESLDRQKK